MQGPGSQRSPQRVGTGTSRRMAGMGNISAASRIRVVAAAAAVVLASLLASCGILSGPGEPRPAAATGNTRGAPDGAQQPPSASPAPVPVTPTPGKGPGCAAVRCATVLVTGDMLVHPQLWQQAREDARAAGTAGLDFGPLLEGQRPYIETSDLAVCHL